MKYRFGTREWAAAVHGVFAQRASTLVTLGITERVSICEVYRNVPPELGWNDNELAWSCVYEDGAVDFALRERDDVAFKVAGDFSAFIELSTFVIGNDPARETTYRKLAMEKARAGQIELLIGNGFVEPGNLESVHDVLARLTEHH